MFWRFGGYANISAIDTILDKPEFTLEELLDESDLIQELKQHNSKLLDYLRQRDVLERLLEYVVAPKLEAVAVPEADEEEGEKARGRVLSFGRPRASSRATDNGNEEDEAEKKRNKYAYVACEILSSDNWSICEALMENSGKDLLRNFWTFMKRPEPLDPLQASYFTKVNESLFDKKTEEMVEFLKSIDGAVPDMLAHVDCPMVMDLLLKIISLERTDSGQGIVEWLYTQDLMPSLLSFLDPQHSWATQTSAGDFMKAIITVSANASQNEQTCIGPNELTRQLVSKPCIEQLINYMLAGGNALTVGVGIVIEVIRKNNSDYDPDVGAEASSVPSSRDPIYLGTLLRMFAENVPNFMNLIMNTPAQKARLDSTFGDKIEPLGFDRFKTCELMAELLHCSNMGLLNEVGSEELIAARDTERKRLRVEGKLTAMRGEEVGQSADDLTMRISHSSPADEGRRLEVTNISDEDGFEEVTHSAEMAEDTSHEFVKAEEEIPTTPPTTSLLEKDEDDFVEEPLSSPRLRVHDEKRDEKPDETEFEPDLVVAPLSPSKNKSATSGEDAKPEMAKVEESAEKMEELSLEEHELEAALQDVGNPDQSVPGQETSEEEPEPPIVFTPTISVVVDLDKPKPEPITTEALGSEQPSPITKELSPHPEDTPAPLFSKPSQPPTGSTEAEPAAPEQAESEASQPTVEPEPPITEGEPGEASIIVGHRVEPPAPEDAHLDPVVGDFLKMQFVEHQVVPTILGFFFGYPWNNFLHNVVYDIVQQVFNGPMDRGYNPTLAISLFEAADVTTQIINGQLASEQSQARSKTRMGYMGHLTLIAEEVVKFTERHPPELLSETVLDRVMSQDWINYVEGALAETRERDNAILGGVRPEVAMSNRAASGSLATVGLSGLGSALGLVSSQGASSALAEAGLNGGLDLHGNGDAGPGAFSISAGISSGFHSSSDEDDDDADENDEDVNQEFRAYTDPLNAATSSTPPSIPPPPPPPPPLNIPPSRARLQLAARLAMNKRNAAAAAENGGEEAGGSKSLSGLLQAAPVVERLHNPFADDEDDDDVDEGSDEGDEGGGWNRGSWWRGVVRRKGGRRDRDKDRDDRFGDGRDDSSGEDDEDEDEEFGDFAMPEVSGEKNEGGGSGIDKEREKVLFKPLPVHPPAGGGGASKFGSLWPFEGLGFGSKKSEDGKEEVSGGAEGKGKEADSEGAGSSSSGGGGSGGDVDEEPEVVGEDGHRVSRVTEAKRRTSIDEPDEDEEVVV